VYGNNAQFVEFVFPVLPNFCNERVTRRVKLTVRNHEVTAGIITLTVCRRAGGDFGGKSY